MIDQPTYELIDKFLDGKLKGSALDNFKARIKKSDELKQAVESQKEIIAALRSVREAELRAYLTENTKTKMFAFGFNPSFALATAAAIALLVGVFFGIQYFTSSDNTNTTVKTETTDKNTNETISNYEEKELSDSGLANNSLALETDIPPTPQIEVAEDEEEMETPVLELVEEDSEDKYDDAPATPTDRYKIEQEQLLKSTVASVTQISPNFNETNVGTASTRNSNTVPQSTTTAKKKLSRKERKAQEKILEKEESSKADADADGVEEADDLVTTDAPENSDFKTIQTRQVAIEYWKSPVNFKGYNYNGTKLKLYGINQDGAVSFKELDSRLYMKSNGNHYYIEKNTKSNRLSPVTSPALLKVLNE